MLAGPSGADFEVLFGNFLKERFEDFIAVTGFPAEFKKEFFDRGAHFSWFGLREEGWAEEDGCLRFCFGLFEHKT